KPSSSPNLLSSLISCIPTTATARNLNRPRCRPDLTLPLPASGTAINNCFSCKPITTIVVSCDVFYRLLCNRHRQASTPPPSEPRDVKEHPSNDSKPLR
ncbi:hypothetical protein M8C21_003553, partial [Ambrosia artemisiifolia]